MIGTRRRQVYVPAQEYGRGGRREDTARLASREKRTAIEAELELQRHQRPAGKRRTKRAPRCAGTFTWPWGKPGHCWRRIDRKGETLCARCRSGHPLA